jgi:membrane protein
MGGPSQLLSSVAGPLSRGHIRRVRRDLAAAVVEHDLALLSTAIAFRALVSLIPLILLGLALLGAFGLDDTWHKSIGPAIEAHVSAPVFRGIDYSVKQIFSSGAAFLILFAAALLLWHVSLAVSTVMTALNRIHDVRETRSLRRRALTAVTLAVADVLCVVAATLVMTLAPLVGDGAVHLVLGLGRWVVGALLLVLAVGTLVRFAPAERPEARWASAGSVLVVVVWIVASVLFKLWVTSVADFKTAIGNLTVFLFLTTYVLVSTSIFLVGAQLDEVLRDEAQGSSRRAKS